MPSTCLAIKPMLACCRSTTEVSNFGLHAYLYAR